MFPEGKFLVSVTIKIDNGYDLILDPPGVLYLLKFLRNDKNHEHSNLIKKLESIRFYEEHLA